MPLPNLEFPAYGLVVKQGEGKVHMIKKQKGNWYYLSCGNVAAIRPDRRWELSDKPVTCAHCIKQINK